MSFNLLSGGQGIWYGKFSSLPDDVVVQAVTARHGGVSEGCFQSLNPAIHNGDDLMLVRQNRQLIANALGLDLNRFVTAEQVHGSAVYMVSGSDAGCGAFDYDTAIAKTDGLITNQRGVPLMMFFADCVPVMLVDPVKKAIGLCHAGWRGTVAKIPRQTVQQMTVHFGSNPADIMAAIAPSIGPCCYEIDSVVERQIREAFNDKSDKLLNPHGDGKWLLDLWQANKLSLLEAGLNEANIELSNVCTNCNSETFYSYRADHGKTGRLAVVLALK